MSRAARAWTRSSRRRAASIRRRGPRFARELGAGADAPIVVVAAKYVQLGAAFGALVAAARAMPEIRLVIKPHPAEGCGPLSGGQPGRRQRGGGAALSRPWPAHRGGLRAGHRQLHGRDRSHAAGRPDAGRRVAQQPEPVCRRGCDGRRRDARPRSRRRCEPCCMIVRCASASRWRRGPSCAGIASRPTAGPPNGPPTPSFPWRGPERA